MELLNLRLWQKLPEPKPGDWLYVHPEKGQTLKEYIAQCTNRKSQARHTIYLVPLGGFEKKYPHLMRKVVEFLGIYYGVESKLGAQVELPSLAYNRTRDQYDASRLLILVSKNQRSNSLATVAFLDKDLYVSGLNFVFGLANRSNRCGVFSIIRYIEAGGGERTLLRRTLKVAVHETGHLLGLEHCTYYRCSMNGSNSLEEADRRPLHLCPICLSKIQWNTALHLFERYRRLEIFYTENGLNAESDFVHKILRYLRNVEKDKSR